MSTETFFLADLIRSGDPERIAREVYPIARRMAGSVLRSPDSHLIDTAAADAVLAVCRHGRKYRGDAKPTTWIYRIACNAALRCARRQNRWYAFRAMFDTGATSPLPGATESTAGDEASRLDAERLVLRLVANPDWLRIWLLWNEPGAARTHLDIARLTGYTPGSVAATLSKVRRRLADGVQNDDRSGLERGE